MHDLAGVELDPNAFAELARVCQCDPGFPSTRTDWAALVDRDTQRALAEGRNPARVQLKPERFHIWCRSIELMPCLDALRAYVIIHRLPRGSRYGATSLDSEAGALGS